MQVRLIESGDNWLHYQLIGEISKSSMALGGLLDPFELDGQEPSGHLVLNLNDATFLDSSGIGWLLGVNRIVKEHGNRIIVHSVPPLIQRVFAMMSLGEVLTFVDDFEAAKNQIASNER